MAERTHSYGIALFASSGVVTMVPLLCFAAAARRLRMTTLGFLQFLAPSLQTATAVLIFGEPFGIDRRQAFALIWAAIGLYLIDAVLSRRRAAPTVELPE